MDWSDEKWLKLYTRDSLTWLSWSWEARAVFCFMLRKVDRSGVIDFGRMSPNDAVSMLTGVPAGVCARVLPELIDSGTIVIRRSQVAIPRFLEAQDARQSDKLRQAESRSKRLAKATQVTETTGLVSHDVTPSHTASRDVTTRLDVTRVDEKRRDENLPKNEKPIASGKPKPAPDPRLKPLTERLVGIFRELRGTEYQHGGAKDATALKRLLGTHDVEVIAARWVAGLNGIGWKQVSTFAQLASKWNDIAAPEKGAFDPNGGILTRPMAAFVSKPCTVQGCGAESWDGVTCIEHAPEMLERTSWEKVCPKPVDWVDP